MRYGNPYQTRYTFAIAMRTDGLTKDEERLLSDIFCPSQAFTH